MINCRLLLQLMSAVGRVELDLTNRRVQRQSRGCIRMNLLAGVHIGTQCSSFSRARDILGGPPPLRSDAEPWGIASIVSEADLSSIRIHNLLARFIIGVFELCCRLGAIGSLENPDMSRMWLLPILRRMQPRPNVGVVITDFCHYGIRRENEPTTCMPIVTCPIIGKKCIGTKGVRSRTGERHNHLLGKTSSGVFRKVVAETYPRPLCQLWAGAIDHALGSRVVANMSLACQSN